MFGNKIFRVEVVDGVDIEQATFLTGDRVSVGSGAQDGFRLGGAQIVPGHVVFVRSENGKGWEYNTAAAGQVEIDRGNPRTGAVRGGMWIKLGPETRIKIDKVAPPPELKEEAEAEQKEVPLAVALPLMAVFAAGFGWYISSLAGGGEPADAGGLRTEAWVQGSPSFAEAIDLCLESAGADTALRVPSTAPDADYRAYSLFAATDADRAAAHKAALTQTVRSLLVEAHLLLREGEYIGATDALGRVAQVLPVRGAPCPVVSYARADLAALDRRAGAQRREN